MKKRTFYLQHIVELLLLTRPFSIDLVPVPLFIVAILVILAIKYEVEGYTLLTFPLVMFFLISMLG